MKTLNVDKLVSELEYYRKNLREGDEALYTADETSVMVNVLDMVLDSVKEATTHANIVLEEIEE